jgi:hypothetical protein
LVIRIGAIKSNFASFGAYWHIGLRVPTLIDLIQQTIIEWQTLVQGHIMCNDQVQYHVKQKPQTSNQDSQRKRNSSSQFLQGRM